MRLTTHPGRALMFLLIAIMMLPGVTAAQGTPVATPGSPEQQQAVWERLDGVQQVVMRTWGDVTEDTPAPGEAPVQRFVAGLIAEFETEEQAAAALEPIRDWMVASLQVNLVDVDLTAEDAEIADLGDRSMALTATGTTRDMPLTIAAALVQEGDRVLAVGGSVMDEQDLLPLLEGIVDAMLEREPGGEESRDNVGRFSGGLWDIFPEQDAEVLDGMRRQGDLPIYQGGTPTS
ncbi:MAG TPA: hypothetical protein VGR22_10270 [Thermomicrobiales bacterium]|nr:hypothetical protein [Thermomicrobiales bacterium]